KTQAIHHAGTIILDDDIGFRSELLRQRDALLALQIDDNALLAAIAADEIVTLAIAEWRKSTRIVTGAGRFDLQHFGAEIGQREGSRRPSEHAGEIEHAHIGERALPG